MEVRKPSSVARMEFIDSVRYIINDSGLPPYVIEPILKDMCNQLEIETQKQYQRDNALYQKQLKEELENENKDVNASG